MKTYNVTITGQQTHISGAEYLNQTESQVNAIIDSRIGDEYDRPKFDGNSYELNNDQYIVILENKQ